MIKRIFFLVTLVVGFCYISKAQSKPQTTQILIETRFGNIKLKLYNETPQHRDNFIKLASSGFYDSLLFHRVIKDFMIQGGDPNSKHAKPGEMLGNGDVGYRIPAEFHDSLFHKKGVLAAARDENPQKASSGCQFYIVQGKTWTDAELNDFDLRTGKKMPASHREAYKTIGGTPHLDGSYTVYGEVVEGLNVIDMIAQQPTDQFSRPTEDIRMKVSVIKQ